MVNLPRFKYSHTILYLSFNINKNLSIYRVSFRKDLLGTHRSAIGELKQRRRRRQGERQKSNRFILAKQQLCTCITLFCTFHSRRCTTTTWKCLISRSVEDGNIRQQLSFSFPELWYNPLEFNSKTICQLFRVPSNSPRKVFAKINPTQFPSRSSWLGRRLWYPHDYWVFSKMAWLLKSSRLYTFYRHPLQRANSLVK